MKIIKHIVQIPTTSAEHLSANKIGYTQHADFAARAGVMLILAGISSLIHSVVPAWFPGHAASVVARLYLGRVQNHVNPEYRELGK